MKFFAKIFLKTMLFWAIVAGFSNVQAMRFSKEMTTQAIVEEARKIKRFKQSISESLSDLKREEAADGLADSSSNCSEFTENSDLSEHKEGEEKKEVVAIADKPGERLLCTLYPGKGDIKQVEHLILVCDDINKLYPFKDGSYRTVLHIAIKNGLSEVVRLLLLAGADPNIKIVGGASSNGKTAFELARFHAEYKSPLQSQHIRIRDFLENSETQAFILMAGRKALTFESFSRSRRLERLFGKNRHNK